MDDVHGCPSDLDGYRLEDLSVGMSACYARTITEADLVLFAGLSGDSNPLHMNEVYASSTVFKGRIVHGMLSASFLSTVIATKLPGPGAIYVSQNLIFRAPVRIGDTVEAQVTITEIIPEKSRIVLKTTCSVGAKVVIDGGAVVMMPARH